jgi:CspA family cold shock protein
VPVTVSPLEHGGVIEASVREWHDEFGWGVLDSIETPGGCWVHFSNIDADGYRSLSGVATVLLECERAGQDGYPYRAVRVEIPGREPAPATERSADAAYRSRLNIEWDDEG